VELRDKQDDIHLAMICHHLPEFIIPFGRHRMHDVSAEARALEHRQKVTRYVGCGPKTGALACIYRIASVYVLFKLSEF
jgi:hypothetical protein